MQWGRFFPCQLSFFYHIIETMQLTCNQSSGGDYPVKQHNHHGKGHLSTARIGPGKQKIDTKQINTVRKCSKFQPPRRLNSLWLNLHDEALELMSGAVS
jgi:hypothetical protein